MARLAVAMSGGVDSTIATLLLKKAGHNILGLSLYLEDSSNKNWQIAIKIAAHLRVPHQVIKANQSFIQAVISPSAKAYAAGLTPNPCVLCNSLIKIPILWEIAQSAGCEGLATGHYASLRQNSGRIILAEAQDRTKSQAYFLARVKPTLLEHLYFPLSNMHKSQVRKLATQMGLDSIISPESQDVCFLPAGGWDKLVKDYAQIRKGYIVDSQGKELGKHEGLHRFTIGQRRGLGIALGYPIYVLALDKVRATVKVGPKSLLWAQGFRANNPLWYLQPDFFKYTDLIVRIRYTHQGVACQIKKDEESIIVTFYELQQAIAPGQLAVFMLGEIVFGSAWISEIFY